MNCFCRGADNIDDEAGVGQHRNVAAVDSVVLEMKTSSKAAGKVIRILLTDDHPVVREANFRF
jgi:hypothetical protein